MPSRVVTRNRPKKEDGPVRREAECPSAKGNTTDEMLQVLLGPRVTPRGVHTDYVMSWYFLRGNYLCLVEHPLLLYDYTRESNLAFYTTLLTGGCMEIYGEALSATTEPCTICK